ncbi:ribonuclease HII [Labedella populi]|uniref:Ribonuclease HII n=2 Tax=Labedella populi TaxID=2498850 RepID=A0A3S3ZPG2_9MICO|nr:ribonuclease HII [Labedella populi]RWZ61596.1 ribonuclease HII [Labedella populi]
MAVVLPHLDVERDLWARGSHVVIGIDEVGRGAIAGPVAVGVAAIDVSCSVIPDGVRDSKLLSEKRREQLEPIVIEWAVATAVGFAEAHEIDELGIMRCLGLAGKRALTSLHEQGVDVRTSTLLLDGNHDYLSTSLSTPLHIVTRVKADRDCGSVAAASVVAKVARDRVMIARHAEHPDYGWAGNKGYGSSSHLEAIGSVGATAHHRRTWLHATA